MRIIKIIAALFMLNIAILSTKAQRSECVRVIDSFYYVTVDIRDPQAYPMVMSGVGKEKIRGRLSRDKVDSFLVSFYRKYYYVPDMLPGYKKMLSYCLGDSLGKTSLNEGSGAVAIFTANCARMALHDKIRLSTGETVFVSIVKIGGSFWKVDAKSPGIAESSNEYPRSKVPDILECYVPNKIDFYRKPKPGDW